MSRQSSPFAPGAHPLENELNKRVLDIAAESAAKIYLVGGYIRDSVLEARASGNELGAASRKAKDLDYAVEGHDAVALAGTVASRLEGHFVLLDEKNNTARVVLGDGSVLDFAGIVGENIKSDILRRDFTVNAMAWDSEKPDELLDPVGGLKDLESGTVRAISEKAFSEDPLRLLRAFRFSGILGATIDEKTLCWIRAHAVELGMVAAERINYELFLILGLPQCARLVVDMAEYGLLEAIFPELVPMRQVTSNAFHHLGLFEHTIETIPQLETKLPTLADWVKAELNEELSAGVTRLAATRAACILHDIGKPATWVIHDDGRHSFYGHDQIGAEMSEMIAQRLKWSRQVERFIVKLVRWHLRPGSLFHQGRPTDKAVRRFYRNVGAEVPELMLVAFADLGATRGPGLMGQRRAELEKDLMGLLDGFLTFLEQCKGLKPLLDGKDVMSLLNLEPGPVVGEMLAALEEAQAFNEVRNRSQAELFVRDHYDEKYSK